MEQQTPDVLHEQASDHYLNGRFTEALQVWRYLLTLDPADKRAQEGARLAGLMALSAYLLFPGRLEQERSEANAGIPAFVGHGSLDPMVPMNLGQDLASRLGDLAHPVTWRQYPIPHSVSPDEIGDIGNWLAGVLA